MTKRTPPTPDDRQTLCQQREDPAAKLAEQRRRIEEDETLLSDQAAYERHCRMEEPLLSPRTRRVLVIFLVGLGYAGLTLLIGKALP